MKIHSDVLTYGMIIDATRASGMKGVWAEIEEHGSRSRKRRFDVKLEGNSPHFQNPGTGYRSDAPAKAASWDEWGMFIQALFELDPDAIIGDYKTFRMFEEFTDGRFESLTAPYQHTRHNWFLNRGSMVFECKDCEATADHYGLREARKRVTV